MKASDQVLTPVATAVSYAEQGMAIASEVSESVASHGGALGEVVNVTLEVTEGLLNLAKELPIIGPLAHAIKAFYSAVVRAQGNTARCVFGLLRR